MIHSSDIQIHPLVSKLGILRANIYNEAQKILLEYTHGRPELQSNLSAANLAHYLALRRHDLRSLQEDLAEAGLSSLGRCESHVMATLDQVIALLIQGYREAPQPDSGNDFPSYKMGKSLLERNTASLFGPKGDQRNTRIMVTLPTEAAFDERLVYDLIAMGMNCARINCAHDDRRAWSAMINNVIAARDNAGKHCAIMMDLAGQKIRTRLAPTTASHVKLKPSLGEQGALPASLLFISDTANDAVSADNKCTWLAIPESVHTRLMMGDCFVFDDTRGKQRRIDIISKTSGGNWTGTCSQTSVVDTEMSIEWQRRDQQGQFHKVGEFTLLRIPDRAKEPRFYANDRLLLSREDSLRDSPVSDDLPRIGCTHPGLIEQVRIGHHVWFDDGKLGTVVEHIDGQGAWLRVTHSHPAGVKLGHDKGINFPDTRLELPCLTEKDYDDLDFICKYGDMVGFSFVQSGQDMQALMQALDERDAKHMNIVAKIETKVAVKNLPEIIFSTLPRYRLGVMIARGDLAVELGGERMAEIQEELLWLCEAAHIPVIWATQVLESLTKKGIATRPELTDAAMSVRAECVMLNKGAYLRQALGTLDSILTRMQDHQYKKVSRLRALHW